MKVIEVLCQTGATILAVSLLLISRDLESHALALTAKIAGTIIMLLHFLYSASSNIDTSITHNYGLGDQHQRWRVSTLGEEADTLRWCAGLTMGAILSILWR